VQCNLDYIHPVFIEFIYAGILSSEHVFLEFCIIETEKSVCRRNPQIYRLYTKPSSYILKLCKYRHFNVKTSWATWLSPTRDYERVQKLNKMTDRFQYLGRCSNGHCHLITVKKFKRIPSLIQTESVKLIVGETLKRLLLCTTPRLKEPGKAAAATAFGDFRTQSLPSSLLHSGLGSKSLPHSPHTPLGQIRIGILDIFLWFGGGSDGGDSNISPNTKIPPKWHTTKWQFT